MTDQRLRQATTLATRREQGVALMLAVLLLITVSGLALSTMQKVASDGAVAGFQNQEEMAFYAAEAGIADAREAVRAMGDRDEVPTYPADFPNAANPVLISTPGDFETGQQPIYFADPNATNPLGPIAYIGEGAMCTDGCNITINGTRYNHTKWKINVIGQSPSGDQKRLEVVATRLLSTDYH